MTLTPRQTAILKAIAWYRYLTNSQLVQLGMGFHHSVRRATRKMSMNPPKQPLLAVQKFPVHTRLGRREHLYRLTWSGIAMIAEIHPGASWIPQTPLCGAFSLDYAHRKAVIDFRIHVERALPEDFIIPSFHHYFEKSGANHRTQSKGQPLSALTRIAFHKDGFFIPDAIFAVRHREKDQAALFALECVMGNKTSRTLRQIHKHIKALTEGVVTKTYHLKGQDYIALFFFEQEALMLRVISKLLASESFKPFRNHYLFATISDTTRDVMGCWRKVGDPHQLYHFILDKPTYRLRDPP